MQHFLQKMLHLVFERATRNHLDIGQIFFPALSYADNPSGDVTYEEPSFSLKCIFLRIGLKVCDFSMSCSRAK